jgi:hypothetical protein
MVTIIEELGRVHLPPYNEAKHIEVLVQEKGKTEPEKMVLHEDEIELLKMLSRLQKSANIYPENMTEIWNMIRNYARSEWLKGNYMAMIENTSLD